MDNLRKFYSDQVKVTTARNQARRMKGAKVSGDLRRGKPQATAAEKAEIAAYLERTRG